MKKNIVNVIDAKYSVIVIVTLLFIFASNNALSNDNFGREDKIKAVYLYHFANFIKWPATSISSDRFNICIYGDKKIGKYLYELQNESIGMYTLNAVTDVVPDMFMNCQILYIGEAKQYQFNLKYRSKINDVTLIVNDETYKMIKK